MEDRRWMWISVGLTLLVGVCLGVLVDRLAFAESVALASSSPKRDRQPLWFVCNEGSLDAEKEPGYLYPEGFRRRLLESLSVDLDMSDEQSAELETMLEDRRVGARNFWEDMRHAYCDVRDQFRADIRALLNPDQKVRFDAMLERIDRAIAESVEAQAEARGAE